MSFSNIIFIFFILNYLYITYGKKHNDENNNKDVKIREFTKQTIDKNRDKNKKESKKIKSFGMAINELKNISLGFNVTIEKKIIPNYYYQPYTPYPGQQQQPTSYTISYVLNLNGKSTTNGTEWLKWIKDNNADFFDEYHPICFQKIYLINTKCVISVTTSYYFNNYYYIGNPFPSTLALTITPMIMLEEPENIQLYEIAYVPMYDKQNVDWNGKNFCTTLLY